MHIRSMRAEDCTPLASLLVQLGYPSTPAKVAERFRPLQGRQDHLLLVAEETDGAVVGWIHVNTHHGLLSDPFAEIAGLVVDGSRRRGGLGRALVDRAADWATGRGLDVLRVRSNVARNESHPFYERIGFSVAKTQRVYRRPLGTAPAR